MTILFQGSVSLPAGVQESAVFAVPNGIKQAGTALNIKVSVQGESFPAGTTTITLFISLDGKATFHVGAMTVNAPRTYRGAAPHFETMTYSLGPDDAPTHAKFSTNAPSAFVVPIVLEAL
mgnify:CR=1 FL=1